MLIRIRWKAVFALLIAAGLAAATAFTLPAALRGAADENPPGQSAEPVEVPILMYHSVCVNDKVRSAYYLSPEAFENDLKYLKDHGYTAVLISELADWAEGRGSLPEKPVALTFDDGYYNWVTEVLPLLERYGMKATFNVVGAYTEAETAAENRSPAYSYLTWEEIRALSDSGLAEIGSHTWEMHELGTRRGCKKMKGETAAHYAEALTGDLARLQEALQKNCGLCPTTFAYPYGEISREALPVLQKLGFRAALTCDERINRLPRDPAALFALGRINRDSRYSTEAFMQKYGL